MSWYQIDERREISADFITCAEYQLFLDKKRVQGEYCQPDHWNDEQFPKGQAQEPILGVRGQDASQFCKWLSQRQGNKFHYRLPAPEEISDHPTIIEREIGCWCAVGEKRFVCGLNLSQWKEFFLNALNSDWSHILTARARARALARARARDLALALARDLALARPFTSKDITYKLSHLVDCQGVNWRGLDVVGGRSRGVFLRGRLRMPNSRARSAKYRTGSVAGFCATAFVTKYRLR